MIRQRTCAPLDILSRRDRVVTTFGRAGIRPAARPRRHFSGTSPLLRLFFARPYTVTAAARQPGGRGSAQSTVSYGPPRKRSTVASAVAKPMRTLGWTLPAWYAA